MDSKGGVWVGFWKSEFEVGMWKLFWGDRRRVGRVISASSGSAKLRIEGVLWKRDQASESGADYLRRSRSLLS